MKRLLFWTIIVALVWIAYQFYDSQRGDPFDRINLVQVAVTFALAALVQIVWTRDWPMRTVGVLFTALGTAIVFGQSGWRWITDTGYPEWFLDIGRALYTVGGPLLLLGLILWVRDTRRDSRQRLLFNGMPDRRNGEPGRRAADYRETDA